MIRLSAPRPAKGSPGAAKTAKPLITIVAAEDIAVWPTRMQDSVEMIGSFVMKPGCKMAQFYATASTQDGSYDSDGDEDAIVVNQKFACFHPGDEIESENFMQAWLGVPCIVFRDYCDGSPQKVYGTACAPVQLKTNFVSTNDKTGVDMTFEAFASTNMLAGRYTGNMTFAEPFAVPDAEIIAVNATNGFQYKLASDAAGKAIAFASNSLSHNDQITLIGSGGADPSELTASSGVILTSDWVALDGAVLTLQVYESSGGTVLIEKQRGQL